MFSGVKTLYFDYDGTLHWSEKIYLPAFRKGQEALMELGHLKSRDLTDREVTRFLGLTRYEMWEKYRPDLPEEVTKIAGDVIGKEMERLVLIGEAELYPGVIETLEHLKNKGYTLVFLSNCGKNYLENAKKTFPLDKYFEAFYYAEAFGYLPKHEILRQVRENHPEKQVIVGDRHKDMESGYKNNMKTIGCSYGYGTEEELKGATVVIEDIRKLIDLL